MRRSPGLCWLPNLGVAAGRRPAVLIVNSSPGFDGRGDFYAQALNAAGIATFEVDWFHGRGLPVTPVHNLATHGPRWRGRSGAWRDVGRSRATFAWDSRHGSAPYEASARQGKGGIVNVVADPDIARQSREFAATWFGRHLGASSDGTSR
jgi:hypothetical protein